MTININNAKIVSAYLAPDHVEDDISLRTFVVTNANRSEHYLKDMFSKYFDAFNMDSFEFYGDSGSFTTGDGEDEPILNWVFDLTNPMNI